MGAPKQKWTSEEEAALKAGIAKHGAGKWCTILKDPEYSGILFLRSNVDLKDKWRNMNVTAGGYGSRDRARSAPKRIQPILKPDDNPLALSRDIQSDEEIVDAKPLAVSSATLQIAGPKKLIPSSRLDGLIMEAITSSKEPSGPNRTSIATYIEDQYCVPSNFIKVLSAQLKLLTTSGRLIKVHRKYRIAPSPGFSEGSKISGMLLLEGKRRDSPITENDGPKVLTKSQIDAELAKMRSMTAQEAAAAAARAVAEAEVAIEAAEQAAREAEAAEDEAEAAELFAQAAKRALKDRETRLVILFLQYSDFGRKSFPFF